MRKSRFNGAQIVQILRQADAGEKAIGHLCREHAISENSFYRSRRRYGGMGCSSRRTRGWSVSWPSDTCRSTPSGTRSQ